MSLIETVFQTAPEIFKREIRKDPTYHFGFRQWDDVQLAILEHVWTKLPLFDSSRPLTPWLRQIIRNQIKNEKRNCAYQNKIEARIFSNNKNTHKAIAYLNNDPPVAQINADIKANIISAFLDTWKRLTLWEKKIALLYFDRNISCAIIATRYHISRRHAHNIVRIIKDRVLKELKKRKVHLRK